MALDQKIYDLRKEKLKQIEALGQGLIVHSAASVLMGTVPMPPLCLGVRSQQTRMSNS